MHVLGHWAFKVFLALLLVTGLALYSANRFYVFNAKSMNAKARHHLQDPTFLNCKFEGWLTAPTIFALCDPKGKRSTTIRRHLFKRAGDLVVAVAPAAAGRGPSGDLLVAQDGRHYEECFDAAEVHHGLFQTADNAGRADRMRDGWRALERGARGRACERAVKLAREVQGIVIGSTGDETVRNLYAARPAPASVRAALARALNDPLLDATSRGKLEEELRLIDRAPVSR